MDAFESHLLTGKGSSQAVMRMQERLSIQVDFRSGNLTQIDDGRPSQSAIDTMKVCSVLFGYKVVDTLARLSGLYPQTSPPVPRQVKPGAKYLDEVLNRLTSWKDVLLDFRASLELATPVMIEQEDGVITSTSNNHQRLFHFVAKMDVVRKKAGFLQNFSLAAAHLAFLKDTDFKPGEVPDLPDDYVKQQGGRGSVVDQVDAKFYKQFGSQQASAGALRASLQVGFGITPILWLHPTLLATRKGLDRTRLLNTWEALGTDKPPLLEEIEHCILQALAVTAVGLQTPFSALERLRDSLPWERIENMDEADNSWFILSSDAPKPRSDTQNDLMVAGFKPEALPSMAPQEMPRQITPEGGFSDKRQEVGLTVDVEMEDDQAAQSTVNAEVEMDTQVANVGPVLGQPADYDMASEEGLLLSGEAGMDVDGEEQSRRETGSGGEDRRVESGKKKDDEKSDDAEGSWIGGQPSNAKLSGNGEGEEVDEKDSNDERGNDEEESTDEDESGRKLDMQHGRIRNGRSSVQRSSEEYSDEESNDEETGGGAEGSGKPRRRSGDVQSGDGGGKQSGVKEDDGKGFVLSNEEDSDDDTSSEDSGGEIANRIPGQRKSTRLSSANASRKQTPSLQESTISNTKPKRRPKMGVKNSTKPSPGLLQASGNTIENPIDVDALFSKIGDGPFRAYKLISVQEPKPKPVLITTAKPARLPSPTKIVAYGPRGEKFIFEPTFHFEDAHKDLDLFTKAVEGYYINSLPRHHKDQPTEIRESSMIAVLTEAEFTAMSPKQSLELLSRKHIVLDQVSTQEVKFDAAGLRSVRPLHNVCAVQDTSIHSMKSTMKERIINGTLQQVLDSVNDPEGKFLNCLDFPGSLFATPVTSYATELIAWHYTRGAKGYQATMEYPRAHMRWHLVSTGNTVTWVHIDSDGLCSEIVVVCGKKVWYLGGPKAEHAYTLSDILIFLQNDFYVEVPISTLNWEAVVLTPGTRLLSLMRPSTPHIVLTPEPTICQGGHFYSTPTLKDTIIGIVHSFVCNKLITNTIHDPARALLRRIAQFFHEGLVEGKFDQDSEEFEHLPKLDTFSGVLDLLSLCNAIILANALDPRTYSVPGQGEEEEASKERAMAMETYDLNDIPHAERLEMIHARGICVHLLQWFEAHFEIQDKRNDHVIGIVAGAYLGRQAATIVNYKAAACPIAGHKVEGAPHCSPDMLNKQVKNAIQVWPDAKQNFDPTNHTKTYNLHYGARAELLMPVKRSSPIRRISPSTESTFRRLGTTPLDDVYIRMTQGEKAHAEGRKRPRTE
ncbi:hypothetical protein CVT26_005784 [Gymnopilus dilepis]|uniref:JmjC domain-containing protein n=1 Tax=Gymnopilus dilepis TaxID=231916 RepID=A0A409WBS8_9AGAR|nr:hypothetical protein CVT26_005784 [Gymnopilus dilepis]